MRDDLNKLRVLLLVVLAWVLVPAGARASEVSAARVWADASHTRLVFDLAGKPDYRVDRDGGQVAVVLAGGKLADDFANPKAQGLYRGMRQSRDGNDLTLSLQTTDGSKVRSFVLGPEQGDHYRLVLDLLPAGAGDKSDGTALADAKPAEPKRPTVAPISGRHDGKTVGVSRQITQQAAALLNGSRKVVVAIDAGHGGKDPGAHGPKGTLEKNVTLAVARDLAEAINKQPGMQAVLTRSGDYYIPLARRYQIAREHDADLFVSIHADSFASGDARGSSVWVLSSRGKSSVAARLLADRENSADLIGGVSLDDKSDGLAKVLLDMQQGWAVQASDVVAGNVLKALGQLGPTHRGYVERANFVVLRSPDVPSILVETAFISNPDEERKLRDPRHQEALAKAVMSGVKGYFESTPPPGTWFAAQAARRNGTQLAAATPASDSRVAAEVRDRHRVSRGESLSSIAQQYGVSVNALKNANQLNSSVVRVGSVLAIPAG